MTIDNLFDVGVDNVHMVQVDSFEAATPSPIMPTNLAPTPKQFAFLKKLFAERTNNEEAQILRMHLLSELKAGRMSRTMASEAIDDVLNMPKDSVRSIHQNMAHGQIWVTKSGNLIRVKESNTTGKLYGVIWSEHMNKWDYTGTDLLSDCDHQITAEEASQFGHEHQWCVFCSRPLSDPRSEFAGYGEKCANNNNLPWGEINDR